MPMTASRRPGPFDTLTSGLASIARLPAGTSCAEELQATPQPGRPPAAAIRLYEFEACPFCRRVREAVSYCDLELTIVPCAKGSRHRAHVQAAAAREDKERPTFPYLEDDAAGVKLFESEDIVAHLLQEYGNGAQMPPPALLTGYLASLLRFGRGSTAAVPDAAVPDAAGQPVLTLYSYEGNQFCRLVREVLTELDLRYTLRSVAKGSPRRAELAQLAGRSTARCSSVCCRVL